MAKRKVRDGKNRKIFVGFWDMTDFLIGDWDLIPPGGPLKRTYVG